MAITEMEKLLRERKNELKLINTYGKNLNENSLYYIHDNKIYAESLKENFFPGVFIVKGFDFDILYLNKNKWYSIDGSKLYNILKGKNIDVNLSKDKIKVISDNGTYTIEEALKNKVSKFKKRCKRYMDNKSPVRTNITNILLDTIDSSMPSILDLEDEYGDYESFRFIRKMLKTNYKETNIVDAYATIKSVIEQLYIVKFTIIKLEGTKTKPREIKLENIYSIVPLK